MEQITTTTARTSLPAIPAHIIPQSEYVDMRDEIIDTSCSASTTACDDAIKLEEIFGRGCRVKTIFKILRKWFGKSNRDKLSRFEI